jgi:hypothetical protein
VKRNFAQYGFAYQENLIMACIGGSQAHGAKLGPTDDTDRADSTFFHRPNFLGSNVSPIVPKRPRQINRLAAYLRNRKRTGPGD